MFKRVLLLSSLLMLSVTEASADSLDGDWCNLIDGKLTIDGAVIITPSGNRVMGNYGRHRFIYTAPEGGWHGGKTIVIQQYSEQLMKLTAGDAASKEWRPCQVVS
ncbi:MAG: hypothetical protein ABJH63_09415 [Rhizobiaceae bacterium]